MSVGVLKSPKKTSKYFYSTSALVSTKRSNQKLVYESQIKSPIIGIKCRYLFLFFYLFLETRAEILAKILLFYWEIWRNQKEIGTFGGQTFWAEILWGIWGIFGRTKSTHFGTVKSLSMFSIIQPLFLQKTRVVTNYEGPKVQ